MMQRMSGAWCLVLLCGTVSFGQLMPAAKVERLRKYFPRVDDAATQAVLDDEELILYTEDEMPRAYQIWDGAFQGVHSTYYNISADAAENAKGPGKGGNGNIEFPWDAAGGTHRSDNVYAVRFLQLPKHNGRHLPVVWHQQRLRGDESPGYSWTFPNGTVFGEVLAMRGPRGYNYTFELRTRTKVGSIWATDAFRPFPTAQSLAKRIKELRPQWQSQPQLARAVAHLEHPQPVMHLARLADTNHPGRREFDQTMGIDTLPPLGDDRLVEELLTTTPFKSCEGVYWRVGAGRRVTHAPTTQAAWHIVPRNYDAGFISVDQASCARCHSSANRHVDEFDAGRDWYGRVRGSDRIFSFHPFEPSSVSSNGFPTPVRMRSALLRGGLLERFRASRHSSAFYQRSRLE